MFKLAIEQLRGAAGRFKKWARGHPWPFFFLTAAVVAFLWVLIQTIRLDNMGFQSKTFWDWMDLLLVPAVLALAGLWFSRVQKATELEIAQRAREKDRELAQQENDADREIARDRQRQEMLAAYFDRMTELLLEKNLGRSERNREQDDPESEGSGDLTVSIARAWTMIMLRALDPARVSAVFRFLGEAKVGKVALADIVTLAGQDLGFVDWHGPGVGLSGAKLSGVILVGANLSWTSLPGADLSNTDLLKANLHGAFLSGANLANADLNTADLSRAHLDDANLIEASLMGANLAGANLEGAEVTRNQLLQARNLEGATMPDGTKYEEWIKRKEALRDYDDA